MAKSFDFNELKSKIENCKSERELLFIIDELIVYYFLKKQLIASALSSVRSSSYNGVISQIG
jgi:hypothetical protein